MVYLTSPPNSLDPNIGVGKITNRIPLKSYYKNPQNRPSTAFSYSFRAGGHLQHGVSGLGHACGPAAWDRRWEGVSGKRLRV